MAACVKILLLLCAAELALATPPAVPRQTDRPELTWDELVASQVPEPEACGNCRAGSKPQPATAGLVGSPVGRIIGGGVAYRGQFPWQVALYPNNDTFCGGSLLSDQWVLTAAHCFIHGADSKIRVVLGSRFLSPVADPHRVTSEATQFVVHPDFNKTSFTSDIAVVKLAQPVNLNRYINPVRLPKRSDFTIPYNGHPTKLSGWGFDAKIPALNTALIFNVLFAIRNEECAKSFGDYIRSTHICTSGSMGTRGGCVGDSGNALVVTEEDGLHTQIGIFSFISEEGCTAGFPSAFTRLTAFLGWLQNKTDIALRT